MIRGPARILLGMAGILAEPCSLTVAVEERHPALLSAL